MAKLLEGFNPGTYPTPISTQGTLDLGGSGGGGTDSPMLDLEDHDGGYQPSSLEMREEQQNKQKEQFTKLIQLIESCDIFLDDATKKQLHLLFPFEVKYSKV